jgi:hypothetical protein
VSGDLALPFRDDFLQFGYGEFFLLQQEKQADTGRIAQELERFKEAEHLQSTYQDFLI